jgi:hypothetical protein
MESRYQMPIPHAESHTQIDERSNVVRDVADAPIEAHATVSGGRMRTMNERTEAQPPWTDLRTALWTRFEPMFLWFIARPWVLAVMAGMAIGLMTGSALMGWIEVNPRFLKD